MGWYLIVPVVLGADVEAPSAAPPQLGPLQLAPFRLDQPLDVVEEDGVSDSAVRQLLLERLLDRRRGHDVHVIVQGAKLGPKVEFRAFLEVFDQGGLVIGGWGYAVDFVPGKGGCGLLLVGFCDSPFVGCCGLCGGDGREGHQKCSGATHLVQGWRCFV